MPIICQFFGIVIRMFFDDHPQTHIHAEYQGEKASFDLDGAIIADRISSPTAKRLIREWIDLNRSKIEADWAKAQRGEPLDPIEPLP